jgi:hypothetical protein
MKTSNPKSYFLLLLAGLALASCGGNGGDAGAPEPFQVVPTTVTFTAPTLATGTTSTICVSGGTTEVFIYGGAPPYTVDNTAPAYVSVNTNSVGNRGGNFIITVLGDSTGLAPCFTAQTIVIRDTLNRLVTFTVNNNAS